MNVEGIFLSWIVVKDINKAIQFYTDVVGLTLKEFDSQYNWAEFSGPGGSTLGICQVDGEPSMQAGSNAVITVTVKDLDAALRHYQNHGATLIGDVIEIPGHVKMQTFMDHDGNTMQIVQKLDR